MGILQFADDLMALDKIVQRLGECEFECEAGYLVNHVDFIRLREIAERWKSKRTAPAQEQAAPAAEGGDK